MHTRTILDDLTSIAERVATEFESERRVLSFQEYLELFATDPLRFSRDAARYTRDAFDHYGRVSVERPWGTQTRFKLFDLPWLEPDDAARRALVAQESVQSEFYRVLSNFCREGATNRLILLHGPTGSAKSTVASCVMAALEHYSTLDVGALYRFHWVFPTKSRIGGRIGFGGDERPRSDGGSFAKLAEDDIETRLFVEMRDHPLLLLPLPERRALLARLFEQCGAEEPVGDVIARGELSHKNREVFDALLNSYDGDLLEVLRHVQVERYFISRRYRCGAVTVAPQISVDAGERQVTQDRSLGALPTALQAVNMFEAFGELVDAAGGMVEFSDLLKRPLEAFKYLQFSVESRQVALRSQNIELNCVMMGSANEVQLAAFRQHPEFESFRGRLEMVQSPYLSSWLDERQIYDRQIIPQIRRHVAPHATTVAAMFAVLTRMCRPDPKRYPPATAALVETLRAVEKMDLYATGTAPTRLDEDAARQLIVAIEDLHRESDTYPIYEGFGGASPREMRTVLLDAAQSERYASLSPFAVLDELDELCGRETEYVWLQGEKDDLGYHDHQAFRLEIRERLLGLMEEEFRAASGLVDESRYAALFERYVQNVNYWVKGEKIRNEVTGAYEEPDQSLMAEVETLLDLPDDAEQLRRGLINTIAAYAIDHPDEPIDNARVFASQLRRLKASVFGQRRGAVRKLAGDLVALLRDGGTGLDDDARIAARAMFERLRDRFGYAESSATDAAMVLLKERLREH